ncbi:MAG: radical SAM protein [Candidatus Bathyarchaeota archaeon]
MNIGNRILRGLFNTGLGYRNLIRFYTVSPRFLPSHVPWDPTGLSVWVTTQCNLRCKYCLKSVSDSEDIVLSEETFENIASNIREGMNITFLAEGEPLIHPDFLIFIRTVKERGGEVDFSTNGMLLTKKNMNEIVDLGVDEITFSINGMYDTHEELSPGSNFERIMNNISELYDLKGGRDGKPELAVCFIGSTRNIHELPELVEALSPYTKLIRLNNLIPWTPEMYHEHLSNDETRTLQIFEKSKKVARETGVNLILRPLTPKVEICWEPWLKPYVAHDGAVIPCCLVGDHYSLTPEPSEWFDKIEIRMLPETYVMGNLNDTSLDEIWNNHKYRRFRKRLSKAIATDRKRNWTLQEYSQHREEHKDDIYCRSCTLRYGLVC